VGMTELETTAIEAVKPGAALASEPEAARQTRAAGFRVRTDPAFEPGLCPDCPAKYQGWPAPCLAEAPQLEPVVR
jgi:hypothetical protein